MYLCSDLEVSHGLKLNKLIDPKEQRDNHKKDRDKELRAISKPPLAYASDDEWMEWVLESQLVIVALFDVLGEKGKEPAAKFARRAIYGQNPRARPELFDTSLSDELDGFELIERFNTSLSDDVDDGNPLGEIFVSITKEEI